MIKTRKTAALKALARTWGEWQQVEITELMRQEHPHLMHCKFIWANNRYEVQAFAVESSIGGVYQITIIRHGNLEPVSYDEMQRIIHELYGPEATAVEVFPPVQYEWGARNSPRVVWVLPSTYDIPFGLHLPTAWGKPA